MRPRHGVFLALVVGMAGYELYALATKDKGDTISEILWDVTSEYPLVPFVAGLLVGHFWWQSRAFKHPPLEG